MEISLEREAALIEAVLFMETEAQDIESLARITRLDVEVVKKAIELLSEACAAQNRGLELAKVSGGFILSPKKELWLSLRERYGRKNDQKLSRAALETLSIVAYSQPITRAEIEAIRGVSADNMIRALAERGLIREVGKKDAPGKPVQFGTTRDFLKYFGLESIADLPRLDDLERERFEGEEAQPEAEPLPDDGAEATRRDGEMTAPPVLAESDPVDEGRGDGLDA